MTPHSDWSSFAVLVAFLTFTALWLGECYWRQSLNKKMRDIYWLLSDMGGLKYSHNHFKAYSASVIKYPNSIALCTDLGTIQLGKVNVNFLSSSNCLYSFNSKTNTKMQHDNICESFCLRNMQGGRMNWLLFQ